MQFWILSSAEEQFKESNTSFWCQYRYPGPTLRVLELLQQEKFRKDVLIPEVVARLAEEGFEASTKGLSWWSRKTVEDRRMQTENDTHLVRLPQLYDFYHINTPQTSSPTTSNHYYMMICIVAFGCWETPKTHRLRLTSKEVRFHRICSNVCHPTPFSPIAHTLLHDVFSSATKPEHKQQITTPFFVDSAIWNPCQINAKLRNVSGREISWW